MGHDVVEVVSSHKTILIEVSLAENVVELIFGKVLTKLGSDLLQLVDGDLALNYINITDLLTSNEPQTLSI